MDCTYCFVDSQNLHLGIKAQGWSLDYARFRVYLKEKYCVNRAFLYIGYIEENRELYESLKRAGFELVFKSILGFGQGKSHIKGNVDVELTVDAIRKSELYSRAIFVSADGDFVALYDYLAEEIGKNVLILIPNRKAFSSLLLKYNQKLLYLDEAKEKLCLRIKSTNG